MVKIFAGLKFDRMEFSGSLGDLGTILPLALAMVLINGMNPANVFLCFGLYYIFSGLYFRVTMPVEPMKVVSAYAIASNLSIAEIQSAALLLGLVLLFLGGTPLIHHIRRLTPLAVIRGVQFSTGILLLLKGFQLMAGTSPYQLALGANEPYLSLQTIAQMPVGIIFGGLLAVVALFLLNNTKVPAALAVLGLGLLQGVILQRPEAESAVTLLSSFPDLLPYGWPGFDALSLALLLLVLPQLPMTVGNAVIANADLSAQYFPETGGKVTGNSLCLSMALANLGSFLLGGIPMCHGAGGLASRYRFGARTGGSNLIIGGLLLTLTLLFGESILTILHYLPMAALGVLLLFAGLQLCLTILDMRRRRELFVVVTILGLTLTFNLAAGFLVGIALAYLLEKKKISV